MFSAVYLHVERTVCRWWIGGHLCIRFQLYRTYWISFPTRLHENKILYWHQNESQSHRAWNVLSPPWINSVGPVGQVTNKSNTNGLIDSYRAGGGGFVMDGAQSQSHVSARPLPQWIFTKPHTAGLGYMVGASFIYSGLFYLVVISLTFITFCHCHYTCHMLSYLYLPFKLVNAREQFRFHQVFIEVERVADIRRWLHFWCNSVQ